MNTSITNNLFTYKCLKCRETKERRIAWGPWMVCCRKEAEEKGLAVSTPRNDVEKEDTTPKQHIQHLKPEDCRKDVSNHLGPFGTMQKTTCGAMWSYEASMKENRKEKLGIGPADVLAWGQIKLPRGGKSHKQSKIH